MKRSHGLTFQSDSNHTMKIYTSRLINPHTAPAKSTQKLKIPNPLQRSAMMGSASRAGVSKRSSRDSRLHYLVRPEGRIVTSKESGGHGI